MTLSQEDNVIRCEYRGKKKHTGVASLSRKASTVNFNHRARGSECNNNENGVERYSQNPCNRVTDSTLTNANEKVNGFMREHATEDVWPCDWHCCQAQFQSASELEVHYMTHTDDKPFVCFYVGCEVRLPSHDLLRFHSANAHANREKDRNSQRKYSHPSTLDLVCSWSTCGKHFKTAIELTRHYQTHLWSAQFTLKCTWQGCDKRFTHNYELKEHYEIHVNNCKNNNPTGECIESSGNDKSSLPCMGKYQLKHYENTG
eukprot:CFRG8667